MVEFAGWEMPVQYSNLGVLASHHWTREKASLFDVSHMLQTSWTGKDAKKFAQQLVVADLKHLEPGSSTLSVFTNEKGGIIDDTVINKVNEDQLYVVSNAGCADKDLAHIKKHLEMAKSQGQDININIIDKSLVALQGPCSASIISKLAGKSITDFGFMTSREMELKGKKNWIPVQISRCGYTGEDGFEISVAHEKVEELVETLNDDEHVELAGLGARDSLRLEAGLCLYGHDLNDDINPIEAGLLWTIGKERRVSGGFLGAEHILPLIKGPVEKRRVGLIVEGAPAREGAEIYSNGELIGTVTSGCPSPVLKKNIAMGYVKSGFHKSGTSLQIKVRNKMQNATIVKMPFVPRNYYRG